MKTNRRNYNKPRQTLAVRHARQFVRAFDYESLSADVRSNVEDHTRAIHALGRRMAADAIELGKRLIQVRAALGPRLFTVWCAAELRTSQSQVSNIMSAASKFGQVDQKCLGQFDVSALYELSRERTSEAARKEALEVARSGEKVSQLVAVSISERHREAERERRPAAGRTRAAAAAASPPAIAAEPRARRTELSDLRSIVRRMIRRWPDASRSEIAEQALEAVREVLAELKLEHLLPDAPTSPQSRRLSSPAPAAVSGDLRRQVLGAGVPVMR